MHIGRRERNVPKRWGSEFSVIGRIMSDIFTTYVGIYDIETCGVVCVVRKINPAMACGAICSGTIKQRKAILCRHRKRGRISLHEVVISTFSTNKSSLECCNRIPNLLECNFTRSAKCFREHFAVRGNVI